MKRWTIDIMEYPKQYIVEAETLGQAEALAQNEHAAKEGTSVYEVVCVEMEEITSHAL